jgi:hypothetical protein
MTPVIHFTLNIPFVSVLPLVTHERGREGIQGIVSKIYRFFLADKFEFQPLA